MSNETTTHKPITNGWVAIIAAGASGLSALVSLTVSMQDAERRNNQVIVQLETIKTQNDERSKSVEFRLSTIEQRIGSLENGRRSE